MPDRDSGKPEADLFLHRRELSLPPDSPPRLVVLIDTEEEFDWDAPFSREATAVRHMRRLNSLQSVFERFRICPTYAVDYPVASQEDGWKPLSELFQTGRALIGAHLHPWVTPPFEEDLNSRNSYHGNLPVQLERAKLSALTDRIEESFGSRPRIFKAGRYGIGPNTYALLAECGYQVDQSPAPPLDFSLDGGPDFSKMECGPFQEARSGLLVLPSTGAFLGWWPGDLRSTYLWATTPWRRRLHVLSALFRSRALDRVWLNPETASLARLIALTRTLVQSGQRVFVLHLHSSSVMPGGTPYARDEDGVQSLLARLKDYLEFFFGELRGEPWTPEAAYRHWSSLPEWKHESCTSLGEVP
jgi:hypothetical protein